MTTTNWLENGQRVRTDRVTRNNVHTRILVKRLFDLAVTIPALVLLAPIMGLIALLVRTKLGRPVLFG